MRLGVDSDPCVIWAWGPAFAEIWDSANISGKPDRRWQWLTINKGTSYGLRRGQFLEILRDGVRIGVAEVDFVEQKYTVAWILDGTMADGQKPKLGDDVKIINSNSVS